MMSKHERISALHEPAFYSQPSDTEAIIVAAKDVIEDIVTNHCDRVDHE